eukprot:COSAG04_NODE_4104_length_2300_cov_2.652431_3_plen_250_part_00
MLTITAPLLVIYGNPNAKDIGLNTVGVLFLLQFDNEAFEFALPDHMRMHVREYGRAEIGQAERKRINLAKDCTWPLLWIAMVAPVVLTLAGAVDSGTSILDLTLSLAFTASGIGAGGEVFAELASARALASVKFFVRATFVTLKAFAGGVLFLNAFEVVHHSGEDIGFDDNNIPITGLMVWGAVALIADYFSDDDDKVYWPTTAERKRDPKASWHSKTYDSVLVCVLCLTFGFVVSWVFGSSKNRFYLY